MLLPANSPLLFSVVLFFLTSLAFRPINMYTSWGNTSRLLMVHINYNSRPSMCTMIVLFRLLSKDYYHYSVYPRSTPTIYNTHSCTPNQSLKLHLYTYCLHSVITIIGSTTLQISHPYPFYFILIETAGESERDKVLIVRHKVTAIIETSLSFRKKTC